MMLSRSASRTTAIGLLGVVLWLALSGWLFPLMRLRAESRASATTSHAVLDRYQALISSEPSLKARFAELTRSIKDGWLLRDAPQALMQAELLSAVQQLAERVGIDFRNSRSLSISSEDGFDRVGIEVEFSTSTQSLSSLLYSIESATPLLFVDHVAVQAPESDNATLADDGEPIVSVSLRIDAYAQPSAATGDGR